MSEDSKSSGGIKWYHVHGLHSLLVFVLFLLYSSPVYYHPRYSPWVLVILPLAVYMIFFDWLRVKWSLENGGSFRNYRYYIMLVLLFRRLPGRKCRPAFGTYWKHRQVKHSWMLIFIKSYYLPLCVGSIYYRLEEMYMAPARTEGAKLVINQAEYLVMWISALIAAAGYSIENKRLGYPIKSVETNIFGVLFCLMCYPPVRELLPARFITAEFEGANRIIAQGSFLDNVCGTLVVVFMAIHVIGIFTQGLRFANLTYRGTVTKGIYSYVRHPQYCTKILWFLFAFLPQFGSWFNVLCFIGWSSIYLGRTLTEERFLKQFSDYRDYCEQVKWRYIPGLW